MYNVRPVPAASSQCANKRHRKWKASSTFARYICTTYGSRYFCFRFHFHKRQPSTTNFQVVRDALLVCGRSSCSICVRLSFIVFSSDFLVCDLLHWIVSYRFYLSINKFPFFLSLQHGLPALATDFLEFSALSAISRTIDVYFIKFGPFPAPCRRSSELPSNGSSSWPKFVCQLTRISALAMAKFEFVFNYARHSPFNWKPSAYTANAERLFNFSTI